MGTGRNQETYCGTNLRGLGMIDPNTGQPDCSWVPQIVPYGSNYVGAWAMFSTSTQLWVGGKFSSISGVAQSDVARFTF